MMRACPIEDGGSEFSQLRWVVNELPLRTMSLPERTASP